jgi:hypothetical protein
MLLFIFFGKKDVGMGTIFVACIPKSVIFRPFSGFLSKGATISLRIIFFKSIALIFLHSHRVGELRTMQFEMLETMAKR